MQCIEIRNTLTPGISASDPVAPRGLDTVSRTSASISARAMNASVSFHRRSDSASTPSGVARAKRACSCAEERFAILKALSATSCRGGRYIKATVGRVARHVPICRGVVHVNPRALRLLSCKRKNPSQGERSGWGSRGVGCLGSGQPIQLNLRSAMSAVIALICRSETEAPRSGIKRLCLHKKRSASMAIRAAVRRLQRLSLPAKSLRKPLRHPWPFRHSRCSRNVKDFEPVQS